MKDIIYRLAVGIVAVAAVYGAGYGIYSLFRIRWYTSESVASGIVYNVKNDKWISGATSFGIRASVDTVVNENTESTYCLPKGSPYIDLINEAAENKDIKVIVRTSKVSFRFSEGATTCIDNVVVERQVKTNVEENK